MNYFLVLNLFFECFFTGKILSISFLLTHPVNAADTFSLIFKFSWRILMYGYGHID